MVLIRKFLVSPTVAEKVIRGNANTKRYITIHETDNTNSGADADAHSRLQANGNSRSASWHWTVDDKEAVQSFEHKAQCLAAGNRTGNDSSIQIEICVNSDGNYKMAVRNAADLVKKIMKDEGIPLANIVQHNKWSGKNCPKIIRSGKSITWPQFINLIAGSAGAVATAPKTYMELGDIGANVKQLQTLLNKAGADPQVSTDGNFGPATKAAVEQFQRRANLTVDGLAGLSTMAKLEALNRPSVPAPAPAAAANAANIALEKQAEAETESDPMKEIFYPTTSLLNQSAVLLQRLADVTVHGEDAISPEWREKLLNKELTLEEMVALQNVAIVRGLIGNSSK